MKKVARVLLFKNKRYAYDNDNNLLYVEKITDINHSNVSKEEWDDNDEAKKELMEIIELAAFDIIDESLKEIKKKRSLQGKRMDDEKDNANYSNNKCRESDV